MKILEVIPYLKTNIETKVHLKDNLVHPIHELPRPLYYYPWFVYFFRDL